MFQKGILARGADIDIADKFDKTALMVAARSDNFQIVEVRLSKPYLFGIEQVIYFLGITIS